MKKLWLKDTLETERCLIKIPEESEAENIWNLISDDTTKYMIWEKTDTSAKTLESIQKNRINAKLWTSWDSSVFDKVTGKCIWMCWINSIDPKVPSFEIWYWISEQYYGKGLIPECLKEILRVCFTELGFEKWIISCDSRNINSEKVALKCGFEFEWKFKNHKRVKWKLRDTSFYWITREQYLKNK